MSTPHEHFTSTLGFHSAGQDYYGHHDPVSQCNSECKGFEKHAKAQCLFSQGQRVAAPPGHEDDDVEFGASGCVKCAEGCRFQGRSGRGPRFGLDTTRSKLELRQWPLSAEDILRLQSNGAATKPRSRSPNPDLQRIAPQVKSPSRPTLTKPSPLGSAGPSRPATVFVPPSAPPSGPWDSSKPDESTPVASDLLGMLKSQPEIQQYLEGFRMPDGDQDLGDILSQLGARMQDAERRKKIASLEKRLAEEQKAWEEKEKKYLSTIAEQKKENDRLQARILLHEAHVTQVNGLLQGERERFDRALKSLDSA